MTPRSFEQASRHCVHTFAEVGDRIEREWARVAYADDLLPKIAAAALTEASLHQKVTAIDIASWIIGAPSLGAQPNADINFGQPNITVYTGRRFYIEVLQWLEATTAIHQHAFSGAFSVLGGSSVHTTHAFAEAKRFGDHLMFGDLSYLQSEILKPGDVRTITRGAGFIHSLFHLQEPSFSVVARSMTASNVEVQFAYEPPYVAFDGHDSMDRTQRAAAYLHGLWIAERAEVFGLVERAIAEVDPRHAFDLIGQFSGPTYDEPMREAAMRAAEQKFGTAFPALKVTLQETHRTNQMNAQRQRIKDPGERLFLALLLNVPDGERIISLVKESDPSADAYARIEGWVRSLMGEQTHRSNVVLGSDAMLIFAGMVRQESFDQIVKRLEAVHGDLDADNRVEIQGAIAALQKQPMLRAFTSSFRALPYSELK